MVNNRVGYQAAVVTESHFYLRVNRLNYLLKVAVEDINSFEVTKGFLGIRTLVLWVNTNEGQRYFKFKSTKLDNWIESFRKVGVDQQVNGEAI